MTSQNPPTAKQVQQPLVSVIMNCYNGESYLREAIDSVFAQTYQNWEIIFWDNQSTDASAEIARRYEGELRYFKADQFLPLGAARNEAVARARGEYLALLDCDDVWLPHKLERQVAVLDSDPSNALIFSDAFFIDADGRITGTVFERARPPAENLFMGLLTGRNFIPCVTAIMRRNAVKEVGGFNPSLRYSEEYDLFVRIAAVFGITYLKEQLAKYRLHETNLTGTGSPETTREAIWVIKTAARRIPPLSRRDLRAIRKRLIGLRCKLIVQYLRQGDLRNLFHHTV